MCNDQRRITYMTAQYPGAVYNARAFKVLKQNAVHFYVTKQPTRFFNWTAIYPGGLSLFIDALVHNTF